MNRDEIFFEIVPANIASLGGGHAPEDIREVLQFDFATDGKIQCLALERLRGHIPDGLVDVLTW